MYMVIAIKAVASVVTSSPGGGRWNPSYGGAQVLLDGG